MSSTSGAGVVVDSRISAGNASALAREITRLADPALTRVFVRTVGAERFDRLAPIGFRMSRAVSLIDGHVVANDAREDPDQDILQRDADAVLKGLQLSASSRDSEGFSLAHYLLGMDFFDSGGSSSEAFLMGFICGDDTPDDWLPAMWDRNNPLGASALQVMLMCAHDHTELYGTDLWSGANAKDIVAPDAFGFHLFDYALLQGYWDFVGHLDGLGKQPRVTLARLSACARHMPRYPVGMADAIDSGLVNLRDPGMHAGAGATSHCIGAIIDCFRRRASCEDDLPQSSWPPAAPIASPRPGYDGVFDPLNPETWTGGLVIREIRQAVGDLSGLLALDNISDVNRTCADWELRRIDEILGQDWPPELSDHLTVLRDFAIQQSRFLVGSPWPDQPSCSPGLFGVPP